MLSMRKTFCIAPSACVKHCLPHPQHAKKQNGENQPQSSAEIIFSSPLAAYNQTEFNDVKSQTSKISDLDNT
jgi:hypothetical protein